MEDKNYYDHFIASILSLPPKLRNELLNAASAQSPDNNPYLYLWNEYNNLDSLVGSYVTSLLDKHKLAID
jgi:hypothetical protein